VNPKWTRDQTARFTIHDLRFTLHDLNGFVSIRPVFFKNEPNRDSFFAFVFSFVVTTAGLRLTVSDRLCSANLGIGFSFGSGFNRGSGFNPGSAGIAVSRFKFGVSSWFDD